MTATTAIDVVDGVPRLAFPMRVVVGAESVITRVAIRIWTLLGVWPDDRLFGLPWLDWTLRVPDVVIEGTVRRQVAAVPGVVSVIGVTVSRQGTELSIGVHVEVSDGDDGTVTALVGDLGVWEGVVPGAWYQIVQTGHRPIVPVGGYS